MTLGLMDLPTELRIPIYRELLAPPDSTVMLQAVDPPKPGTALYPAILSTCKTVYEEALSILYRFNIFTFNSSAWVNFKNAGAISLGFLGPKNVALIRRMACITFWHAVPESEIQAALEDAGIIWDKLELFMVLQGGVPLPSLEAAMEKWRAQKWLDEYEYRRRDDTDQLNKNSTKYPSWFVKKGGMKVPLRKIRKD